MTFTQLDPMIPMMTPTGKGFAIGIADYSQEHNGLWVVADDKTGEIWWWPNDKVRMQTNISMGRNSVTKISVLQSSKVPAAND